ncbi:MFS transporter [Tsukamurella sp. 8F]|uniref:MFS transporter n=1 Tax=unclassified Tsukamurella TaxID=2633480 RepID=UPI0023B9EFEE|nr:MULTISPECIES: MFS transporter [unclassified Tsukamurella]MDF0529822.1 MFS transporter [Tsukamurella sp. 8J]MDF0587014.1 MFS transporter [Tsukamurella sp. 8F]
MFASLKTRNYRYWASGQVVSLVGTWMQRVAQDWLVLDLAHADAAAVGIVMALQFGPTLVLSPWAGVLADRYPKRRLLLLTQGLSGMCALLLAVLVLSGVVALWQVFVVAFVFGCVSAVDAPVRQAFSIEMVGPTLLPNAIALNSMVFNAARIVGPAIAGVLIAAVGTGWVFAINAVSTLAVLSALLAMTLSELHPSPPVERGKGQVRAGFAYVRAHPELLVVIVVVFFVSTFGINFPLALSALARNGFGLGAEAYGLMSTVLAIGTLGGAALAAKRSRKSSMRMFLVSGTVFGVAEMLAGFAPWFWLATLLLIPVGLLQLTFSTSAMSMLQLGVDKQFRGRVMGIYMLAFLGGTPIGAPLLGVLSDATTPAAPMIAGGVISALSCVACVALLRRRTADSLSRAESIRSTE